MEVVSHVDWNFLVHTCRGYEEIQISHPWEVMKHALTYKKIFENYKDCFP